MFAIGDKEWPGVSKLLEEMGELSQVLGKLMGSRGDTNHWSGDLKTKLIEEMGDTLAALTFVADKCLTADEDKAMQKQADTKYFRFNEWHDNELDKSP